MDGSASQTRSSFGASSPFFVGPVKAEGIAISSRSTVAEIERIVRREIPVGSLLAEAQEFLEEAGFKCRVLRGETSFYGAIRELDPPGEGILRGTMSDSQTEWPAIWNCVVDIHIIRGAAADCRVVAFVSR